MLLCTSQAALAQDARVLQLQDELNRLEQTVQQAKEAYYANPSERAMASAIRAYEAYEDLAQTFREALSQTEAGKNEATLDTGGPDGFGYTYIDNTSPGGPSYSFTSISNTAEATLCTPFVGCGADDSGTLAGIGFTFNFYGVDYTTTAVTSNGYLNPTGDLISDFTEARPITNASTPNGIIAPLWDDLQPNAAGEVFQSEAILLCRYASSRSVGGFCVFTAMRRIESGLITGSALTAAIN